MTKPFGMMELVSRIKAVLRRSGRVQEQDMLSVNGVSVDVKKHEVKVAGEIVTLTLKEFELLERLNEKPEYCTDKRSAFRGYLGI